MKQIIINEKCNGCGMCIVKCPNYFEENDDGNAQVIKGVLAGNDEVLDTVISECPVKAISLGNSVDRKQSIQEELDKLKVLENGLTVKRDDIAFTDACCIVTNFPYIGSSRYEYRSSSSAESAGLDAFTSRAYSQIDSKILDVITRYRVNIIKPYYSTDERSVYTQFNKKISDVLTAVANLVGKDKLPSDFCNVDVYPDRDTVWKMLEKGEIVGENFVSIVKREFEYSASYYRTYIDYDDTEVREYGRGMFGRDREVTKYCYRAQDAVEELRRDVQSAVGWARSDIEDGALGYVQGIVSTYNQKLKTYLEKKLALIKNLISCLNNSSGDKCNSVNKESVIEFGTVKLKSTATKYCSTSYSLCTTPARFFDLKWEFMGRDENVTLYNMKLMSEGIIILVPEDSIVKI